MSAVLDRLVQIPAEELAADEEIVPCPVLTPGLVNIQKILNMAIEIVDFPIKNCDFPWLCGCLSKSIILYLELMNINLLGKFYGVHQWPG